MVPSLGELLKSVAVPALGLALVGALIGYASPSTVSWKKGATVGAGAGAILGALNLGLRAYKTGTRQHRIAMRKMAQVSDAQARAAANAQQQEAGQALGGRPAPQPLV